MAIEVLPPQLANQIAAGEVVERPASVIKELVENSIDAGASRIDIEIDKGGSKLIRIRDNGSGIAKDQLGLALSRHATSKMHSLDDLDAIMSFGFRGEALASISSVSRLTLTSRPAEQVEAWQAYAEGSQMAVKINPAAHPVGTTIEAVDLFFNTPARRRFLKSDKTEFTHIDEWLKRIAVVQPSVHFTLQHNGKMVRNYRPAITDIQYIQRLSQISSRRFAENALQIECQHEDLRLTGYLQAPQQQEVSAHLDVHFFYVNGRLVRDRLVNHAVRQAFSFGLTHKAEDKLPSYVLMLELDPLQVDVNVHPAKHEVRFHQARYVHDYILQALQSALCEAQSLALADAAVDETHAIDFAEQPQVNENQHKPFSSSNSSTSPSSEFAYVPNETNLFDGIGKEGVIEGTQPRATSNFSYSSKSLAQQTAQSLPPQRAEAEAYCELVKPTQTNRTNVSSAAPLTAGVAQSCAMPPLLDGQWWVMADGSELKIVSIQDVALQVKEYEIATKWSNGLLAQPLLMPVAVPLDADWAETTAQHEVLLRQLGIEVTIRYQQLIIKKVPPYLRNAQIATVIPELLQWLRFEQPAEAALVHWLANHSVKSFTHSEEIWRGFNCLSEEQQHKIKSQAMSLPWQIWLKEQLSDKD